MKLLTESAFFGVAVSLLAYFVGVELRKKLKSDLMNPLLFSVAAVIAVLLLTKVEYETYYAGAKVISFFLTPATVCLAVPLYEKLGVLRKNKLAILVGIGSGVLTAMVLILLMSVLFGLSHTEYVTLLPKSITTAIGMGVSEELGGYVTLTVAIIILSGIQGNMMAPLLCRLFRITDPVAKGIGIGAASHAIGTSRAIKMGETEGAMSGLSMAVTGILTVIAASIFAVLY